MLQINLCNRTFSLVNTALLRPPPVERPGQIDSLADAAGARGFPAFSYPNYKDIRDHSGEVFDGLYAYCFASLSVSHEGTSERLWGYVVTGNYFEVLGVKAVLGRALTPDDDRLPGAHPVAVLSYESWQRRFGADPAVVGRSLIVNGRSYEVVGVLPKGFYGTEIIAAPELWFPVSMQAEIEVGDSWLDKRGVENLLIQGRLKQGVTCVVSLLTGALFGLLPAWQVTKVDLLPALKNETASGPSGARGGRAG